MQIIQGFFEQKKKKVVELFDCPSCGKMKPMRTTGAYCTMECYYDKLWRRI